MSSSGKEPRLDELGAPRLAMTGHPAGRPGVAQLPTRDGPERSPRSSRNRLRKRTRHRTSSASKRRSTSEDQARVEGVVDVEEQVLDAAPGSVEEEPCVRRAAARR